MAWTKGTSGNPKGRPKKNQQAVAPDQRIVRADGWESLLTGLGQSGYDKRVDTTFGTVNTVSNADAMNLWRGNDIARKIIEKLPKEEIRAGFALTIQDNDDTTAGVDDEQNASERVADVTRMWKKLGAVQKVKQARCYQRAYGGSAILLGALDNQSVDQPLNIDTVRSLDWLTVLEPREITPAYYYSDPNKAKFGEAEIWQITPITQGNSRDGKVFSGSSYVHESRLIIFPGITVSRLLVTSGLPGWGDSILTPVHEILRDYGIGWSAAAVLLADFSQAIYKMAGLEQLLSADTADDFVERMRMMERSRSVARCVVIDKDEEFDRKTTSVQGLPELLDEFKARVAAAADMPVTVLFGTSAKGLNATGEGDQAVWYDEVAACREEFTIPAMERITELCLKVTGGIPDRWELCGKPLHQMTAKEEAEICKIHAETDSIRIADRVVSAEEVAISRYGGGAYGHDLRIDFDARDKGEPAAPVPVGLPPIETKTAPSTRGKSTAETTTSTETKKTV
jgi:phage-related protein (TIGR01555 family)